MSETTPFRHVVLVTAAVLIPGGCEGGGGQDSGTTTTDTSSDSSTRGDTAPTATDPDGTGPTASDTDPTSGSSTGGTSTDDTSTSTGEPGVFLDYDVISSSYVDAPDPGMGANFGPQLTRDVAFDDSGNLVIVGGTSTASFPTTPGAYDTDFGGPGMGDTGQFGEMDVFVAKLDREGNLLWSTLLGGPSYDRAYAVEVGPGGDVFVAGRAGTGFPTTAGVVQPNFAGDNDANNPYGPQDGFVARLSADGSALLWSTYIGGTGRGFVRDMDVDAAGEVYVALSDVGGGMVAPVQAGPSPNPLGGRDGYYGRLSSDGQTLAFGTYLGGATGGGTDGTNPSIRVTDAGDVFFLGFTAATDLACITPGAYQPDHGGDVDLFLARFDASNALTFCTYFGGSGFEGMETHDLAVDAEGRAYIAGGTNSADLPVTPGAAQPMRLHDADGFVALLSSDGSDLVASTYVGMDDLAGTIDSMNIEGLALTPNGDVVAGGSTRPMDNSMRHGVIARLSGDLSNIQFMQAYGGSARDELRSVAVAPSGEVLYGGHTTSADLMTVNAYDSDYSCSPHLSATYLLLAPIFE